ncbi:MAG: hypothetical protein WKF89_11160 [Chitinophagaceae bacterium]
MNKALEDHLRNKFRELFNDLIVDAPKEFMERWDKTINIVDQRPVQKVAFRLNESSFELLPNEMQQEAKRLFNNACARLLA